MTGSLTSLSGDLTDEPGDGGRFDAIVIGAGLCGLYQVYRLREQGYSVQCFEEGAGVGGTWFWNRYPGCAFDSPSEEYGYSFSEDILQEWNWTHYYSYQPDAERYLNFVADKLRLRKHIRFNSRVVAATWVEDECFWEVELGNGERACASFLIASVGGLTAAPYTPRFEGMARFRGEQHHIGRWPADGIDFTGKRVAVIGSGPSAIQLIPEVAKQCAHLTVFQRTANYAFPADNDVVEPQVQLEWKANYPALHQKIRTYYLGIQHEQDTRSGADVPREERLRKYEEAWKLRGYAKHMTLFWDLTVNREINAEYSDWLREKIRQRVDDPTVAEKLVPTHPFGAKPAMLESGYYETFNRENVLLVDVKEAPIKSLTEEGIETGDQAYEFDVILYGTGYDARTGPLTRIDVRGVDGGALSERWDEHGPVSYLGLMVAGFPNFFFGSPSALCSTYTICAEWSGDWIVACLDHMRANGHIRIEPTQEAEDAWVKKHDEVGSTTLFNEVDSNWLAGTNIPGRKWRRLVSYAKTGPLWYADVLERGYDGFIFGKAREKVA